MGRSLLFGTRLGLKPHRRLRGRCLDSSDDRIFRRFQFAMALSVPTGFNRVIPLLIFLGTGEFRTLLVRLANDNLAQ